MRLLAVCAVALVFGFAGSMPLAGPIAIMVFSRAAQRRFGEALRIGVGAAVAEGFYAGLAFWGFTTFFAGNAMLMPVSHAAAALVLSPLGIRFMLWRPKEASDRREKKAGTALLGFTIAALNPTLLVTWSAAAAFVYSKGIDSPSAAHAIPFGLCAAAGVGAWALMLVLLLRRYGGKLPRIALSWTVRVLGLVLLALGVWSGVEFVIWFVEGREPPAANEGGAFEYPGRSYDFPFFASKSPNVKRASALSCCLYCW